MQKINKCENCIHEKACKQLCDVHKLAFGSARFCDHYKDKSLIVELPCEVGDKVYVIEGKTVLKGIVVLVKSVTDNDETRFFVQVETEIEDPFYEDKRKIKHGVYAVWRIEYGSWNRAFYTKEEAEAKAKELEGK